MREKDPKSVNILTAIVGDRYWEKVSHWDLQFDQSKLAKARSFCSKVLCFSFLLNEQLSDR